MFRTTWYKLVDIFFNLFMISAAIVGLLAYDNYSPFNLSILLTYCVDEIANCY